MDGRFHSGEQLAKELGVTRAAIWKYVKLLQSEYDLDIHAVTGKGYRLPVPIELLDKKQITSMLAASFPDVSIETFLTIGSTNKYLLKHTDSGDNSCRVVFAERQTDGRGRHGRQWVSPFGGNLYFSILYQFNSAPGDIIGLSLAVGVAIVEFLQKNGVESAGLKWPNDILVDGRKLCGILLEMHGESHGPYAVIIGVGLNINMPAAAADKIDQAWIALNQVRNTGLSRNELAAQLLIQILTAIKEFERSGISAFRDRWIAWDSYMNEEVLLRLGDREVSGISRGIDQQGALLLEQHGQMLRFYSGEISLRPVK